MEVGTRIRVVSDQQTREDEDGPLHCNGWEPIATGTEGLIVPQYPNDGGPATRQWSDGTILVRRDDGSLFSIWPELIAVV